MKLYHLHGTRQAGSRWLSAVSNQASGRAWGSHLDVVAIEVDNRITIRYLARGVLYLAICHTPRRPAARIVRCVSTRATTHPVFGQGLPAGARHTLAIQVLDSANSLAARVVIRALRRPRLSHGRALALLFHAGSRVRRPMGVVTVVHTRLLARRGAAWDISP